MRNKTIPITDLRKTNDILKLTKENNEIFITKNGYNQMVIMSNENYEKLGKNEQKNNQALHINKQYIEQDHCHGLINVGCYSLKVKVGNVKENVNIIKNAISRAIKNNISILVLPELCICGYTCGDLLIHSSLHDEIKKGIKELKTFTKDNDILVFIGAPISFNNTLYNCALVMQNGKILGAIPKRYIPNYKEYYEGRYFASFNEENTFIIIDNEEIPFGNKILFQNDQYLKEIVSGEICEDGWLTHSPSLDQAENGATIIANLSASNESIGKDKTRRILVQEASRKLNCAYLYCSSSCEESTTDLLFSGATMIGECGDILLENQSFLPNDLEYTIDISRIKNIRRSQTSFVTKLKDDFIVVHYTAKRTIPNNIIRNLSKHPFIYSNFSNEEIDYSRVLLMQSLGLARRLQSINSKKVVLGLSGGLDSTLALLVAIKAFDILNYDKKDIICITLPCFGTSKRTFNNATALSNKLGNTLIEINISNSVTQHLKDLNHDENLYDVTYENSQARERTQVLMDYANKVNGIVLGTGDLSEISLGWSTYNGDHMSMYAVNASIPKTLIRKMVSYFANNDFKIVKDTLLDILDTPISPELIPSSSNRIEQITEDIVGPYELHDFFLYHLLNSNHSFSKIYLLAKLTFKDTYSPKEIKLWLKIFIKRFFSNQFKRSCMPDGIKVTSISLSPRGDLRLPSDISYQSFIDEIDNLD